MAASYPKTIASWTNRVDQVDTVWAADPNTLASEILAVETTVGPMPQVEPNSPAWTPVTYSSMSARVSDAMVNGRAPYAELYAANFSVGYGSALSAYGVFNNYSRVEDSWGYYNGSDITIRAPGVYVIDAYQAWEYYTAGYVHLMLGINNVFARGSLWQWDFPRSGPNVYSASYGERWAHTEFAWMGKLNTGDRVRVASDNGTPRNPYKVINSTLRICYLRSLTSAQAVQGPSTYPA